MATSAYRLPDYAADVLDPNPYTGVPDQVTDLALRPFAYDEEVRLEDDEEWGDEEFQPPFLRILDRPNRPLKS